MNFLAHVHLSGDDEKVMVGNFIADFVKGKQALASFEGAIKTGIELHRTIDYFTDNHPVVGQSKNRLRPKYRHYAGVIVDVFYDHFLASHWDQFSPVPLAEFVSQTYDTLESFRDVMPAEVNEMLPYMIRGNWLVNYGKTEGIARALTGMSRRTPFESKMDEAVQDLIRHREEFKSEFELFFPELQEHARKFRLSKGLL